MVKKFSLKKKIISHKIKKKKAKFFYFFIFINAP